MKMIIEEVGGAFPAGPMSIIVTVRDGNGNTVEVGMRREVAKELVREIETVTGRCER